MRAAIFGGTGFVGSYIVEALHAAGIDTTLLVRNRDRDDLERIRVNGDKIGVRASVDQSGGVVSASVAGNGERGCTVQRADRFLAGSSTVRIEAGQKVVLICVASA